MTDKEYIESGILEAYALGMLPESEAQEVEQAVSRSPRLKQSLREIESSLEDLAMAHSITPPPELKSKILTAASGAPETKRLNPRASEPATTGTARPMNWLAIAATLILLFSLGINALQYQSIKAIKDQLLATELRLASLELQNESMVANYQEMEQSLAVLRDPSTATFVMKGVEGKNPTYRADVFWNPESEKVFLDVKNLPEAPAGKDYQLWALRDGKPVDMGVFSTLRGQTALKEMGAISGADAFAVTLEPSGGSPNPSMEQMYVYGTPRAI